MGESSNTCEWEKKNYLESWNYEIDSIYRYKEYNATYIISTTTGKNIFFRPIQDIVAFAESGDRIMKKERTQFAYLISKNGDSLRSRIFSVSCDSLVKNSIDNVSNSR